MLIKSGKMEITSLSKKLLPLVKTCLTIDMGGGLCEPRTIGKTHGKRTP